MFLYIFLFFYSFNRKYDGYWGLAGTLPGIAARMRVAEGKIVLREYNSALFPHIADELQNNKYRNTKRSSLRSWFLEDVGSFNRWELTLGWAQNVL